MPPTLLDPLQYEPDDVFGSIEERIRVIRSPRWITYPAAENCLVRLQWYFDAPPSLRTPCCLFTGYTNNGKSTIVSWFEKKHTPSPKPGTNDPGLRPVINVQTPPAPDARALLTCILTKVGAVHAVSSNFSRRLDQVCTLLPKLGTRMLIVDEIQHVLGGAAEKRIQFLDTLKFLSNELRISIVAVGVPEAQRVFQTDQQIGNRFEPFTLPKWKNDDEFHRFLVLVSSRYGFKQPFSKTRSFFQHVYVMSDGLTGEVIKLMDRAAEYAIRSGMETINMDTLEAINWTAPSERRNA